MKNLDEKKILGAVPKKLQLVETFWDCPEFSRNKQKQKGITLIALIITIIVMLILVGVTINVALNGGLFTKASDAAKQTEEKSILEQIIALAVWDNNGKINVKATVDNVKQEFGGDKVSTTPNPVANEATTAIVTVTGKHGEYNYKITTSEITLDEVNGSVPVPPSEPEEYYFTFNMLNGIEQKQINYQKINETNGTSMSMLLAPSEEFWNKVGWDLSGIYGVIPEAGMQKINLDKAIVASDEESFKEYYNGAGIVESENLFMFYESEGYVGIYLVDNPGEEIDVSDEPTNIKGIVSETGTEEEELLSWEEFLAEYGDIKFYFEGAERVDLNKLSDLEKLRLYFKDIKSQEDWVKMLLLGYGDKAEIDGNNINFKPNEYISNATEALFSAGGINGSIIEYNNITYQTVIENGKCDFEEIYRPAENSLLRKYVEYDGKKWVVLYDDGTHGLQMVSANVLEPNQIILGIDDNIVNWLDPTVKEEADTDDDGELSEQERGIYSHNNVIKSLNDKCYSLVTPKEGVILDVRCFGSNPILGSKYSESGIDETSHYKLKGGDDNYVDDVNQYTNLYISNNNYNTVLFLASRIVDQGGYYGLRTGLNSSWVGLYSYNPEGGVLPVIILAEGALDNARGSGTPTDPFILE